MESGSATTSAISFRTLGWISSGPMDLYTHSVSRGGLGVVPLLQWDRICSSHPHLELQGSGRHGEESDHQWRLRQSTYWAPQLFPYLKKPLLCSHLSEGEHSLGLSPPAYVPVEPLLVIFHIPCQVQLYLCLGFPNLFLHTQTMSLYSSQATQPCFHFLHISLFSLSLSCRSLLSQIRNM